MCRARRTDRLPPMTTITTRTVVVVLARRRLLLVPEDVKLIKIRLFFVWKANK